MVGGASLLPCRAATGFVGLQIISAGPFCVVLCVTCCQHQERLEQNVFSTVQSNKCFAGRGGGTFLCPAGLPYWKLEEEG